MSNLHSLLLDRPLLYEDYAADSDLVHQESKYDLSFREYRAFVQLQLPESKK